MRTIAAAFFRSALCWGCLALASIGDAATPNPDASGTNIHWSLRPLPTMKQLGSALSDSDSALQPIDRYIRHRLKAAGLSPARHESPHRQVRRLSLMLTGLPPDPAVVNAFTNRPTDDHYLALVDRTLQLPQFGERWARHWMDVVRFAETYGYEWNYIIREAWRYRDYLIRAFNQDLPYDQFIREHIAGDLLDPPRTNEELGLNESLIGGAFYRFGETGHDDCLIYSEISLDVMDNQIDTLSTAFQAMTVSCSRCHDHKIDDIPQTDYYALLGIMASSRQVIRTLDLPHRQDPLKKKLAGVKNQIRSELAEVWLREADGISLETLNQRLDPAAADKMEHPLFPWGTMTVLPEGGGESKMWADRWVQSREAMRKEHERRLAFNRENYVLFGDFTGVSQHRSGWGFEGLGTESGGAFLSDGDFSVLPEGTNVIHGVLPAGFFSHGLSQKLNATLRSPFLPGDKKFVSYQAAGERNSVCRTVIGNCSLPFFHTERFSSPQFSWKRVSLEKLRTSPLVRLRSYLEWATVLDDQGYPILNGPQAEYQATLDNPRSYFGVTKVWVHDVEQSPLAELDAPLQVFATAVSNPQQLAQRYQEVLRGAIVRWSKAKAGPTDVFWLNAFMDLKLLGRQMNASPSLGQRVDEYRQLEARLATPMRITGVADQDDGIDVPLFVRGDVASPGPEVPRRFLSEIEPLIPNRPPRTGSGRRRLAEMIARAENPLTARVMANRIWHYLFGNGIVRSVDNFGKLGEEPSHPELLDYLARRLIDSGWSVKTLVREIVLSDTFRQASAMNAQAETVDPENRLFHRYHSRRLEAEVIRDSMLWASGRLDLTLFGPSIDPYRPEDNNRRKLYAGPLDGAGRRSLYLKVTRMGPDKLLELFNLPDPSATRGRRDLTNVPAQALGLLNHPFVHEQAEVHARHLLAETGTGIRFESSLDHLFLRLLSRAPTEIERREYADYFKELAAGHGITAIDDALKSVAVWKDLIHTLYNLKEFTYAL
jgi:hypothetical protein